MEQFKDLHKTVDQLRTSGLSTGEIKKVSTVQKLIGLLHTYIHTLKFNSNYVSSSVELISLRKKNIKSIKLLKYIN